MLGLIIIAPDCGKIKHKQSLTISANGMLHSIIMPDGAGEVIHFAASELQKYIIQMTGVELRLAEHSASDIRKGCIELALTADTALKWDGFRITCNDGILRISSREPRGLLYGIYSLLEETGCSFFYPGKEEEIIPHKDIISFNCSDRIYNPILEHRGLTPYGLDSTSITTGMNFIDWMAKNRLNYIMVSEERPSDCDGNAHVLVWKNISSQLLPELQKRGFVIEMAEHCMPVFFPRSLFGLHPEWFAMKDGKRKPGPPPYSGQMCYSNREAVDYYANALAGYASKHPEFHVIGTWPLDGGEYCQCENCRDPLTVFKAAERIAEKVKQVRPDILVEHLAYKTYSWETPDKIPSNMSVLWCADAGITDSIAKKWINISGMAGGTYQFEYFMGDNYRTRANVWLRPGYAVNVAIHARDMGFRGVISLFLPIQNWWRASFNNWFFAHACWDPAIDIGGNMHNYCISYYGAEAAPIEGIFDRIFRELQPEPYRDQKQNAAGRIEQVRKVTGSLLSSVDSILKKVNDEKIYGRIVRLRTYIEYARLHCEAMASGLPADLARLEEFSRERPDQQMVLMYPAYIKWRNSD